MEKIFNRSNASRKAQLSRSDYINKKNKESSDMLNKSGRHAVKLQIDLIFTAGLFFAFLANKAAEGFTILGHMIVDLIGAVGNALVKFNHDHDWRK